MMASLQDLSTAQRFMAGAAYVAVCFAIGMGIGALLTRRQR